MRAVGVRRSVLGVQHTVIENVELEQLGRRGGAGHHSVLHAFAAGSVWAVWPTGMTTATVLADGGAWTYARFTGVSAGSGAAVTCPTHGVIAAAVPWARRGSRFTSAFEDTAA